MDGTARGDRFALGEWMELTTGAPALCGALASFDCIVVREIEAATHTIFIGRVLQVQCDPHREPLIYENGRFVGVGK
jgi:flavin reductase (DIM6/NTAB) family NADH-FMN oxidoreductase RutF